MSTLTKSAKENLQLMLDTGVVAVIRATTSTKLLQVAETIQAGGVRCIEITMTTPRALQAIKDASEKLTGVLMGAGTVLDASTARQGNPCGGGVPCHPYRCP